MANLTSCACPTTPVEEIVLGRDNVIAYVLLNNGVAIADLSPVTRVVAKIGDVEVDSDVVGSEVIWWTDQITYQGEVVDYLQMKLGGKNLTAGEYSMAITVYDLLNSSGVLWEAGIPVIVSTA